MRLFTHPLAALLSLAVVILLWAPTLAPVEPAAPAVVAIVPVA